MIDIRDTLSRCRILSIGNELIRVKNQKIILVMFIARTYAIGSIIESSDTLERIIGSLARDDRGGALALGSINHPLDVCRPCIDRFNSSIC